MGYHIGLQKFQSALIHGDGQLSNKLKNNGGKDELWDKNLIKIRTCISKCRKRYFEGWKNNSNRLKLIILAMNTNLKTLQTL